MDQKLRTIIEEETKAELAIKKENAWECLIDLPQKKEEIVEDICCRVLKVTHSQYDVNEIKAGVRAELKNRNRQDDLEQLEVLGGLW